MISSKLPKCCINYLLGRYIERNCSEVHLDEAVHTWYDEKQPYNVKNMFG